MSFKLLDIVGAKSKLELAGRIHKKWKELAPRDRVPAAVAISNRLGDLEKERPAWWESDERPSARKAFEQVTGVPFHDLPLKRAAIASPEFPQLRPFRPGLELPLSLGLPDWFEPPQSQQRRWIVAPPGAGRSFAIQWHGMQKDRRAVEVHHLADAQELFGGSSSIVIGVDAPDPGSDAGALARLDVRDEVLVIAPFAPPPVTKGQPDFREPPLVREGWFEARSPAGRERHAAKAQDSTVRDSWYVQQWSTAPGWREMFVRWIAGRIDDGESLLDVDQLLGWLERVDARGATFAAPADIVGLCGFVHGSGVPSYRRDLAERFLRARMEQEARQDTESTWLRTWGGETVKTLIAARLERIDLPLWGPLLRSTWAELLPADVAPRALEESEIDELLDRKRTSKEAARRKLRRRPAPEAIELLISARLMRAQGTGHVLSPRWVALGFARARIRRELIEGAPATWGRWAVDPDRRDLVDAELEDLDFNTLLRISARAVQAFDRASLSAVGAVEAMFAVLGRRLGPDRRGPDGLHALWELQRSLFVAMYTDAAPLSPRTRPGFESDGDWIACCWAWSLYGPKATVPDAEAWLFPGWCEPSLERMRPLAQLRDGQPLWPRYQPIDEDERVRSPRGAFRRLLEMAFEIVRRCRDQKLPEDVPAALAPAVLLGAHQRTPPWALSGRHLTHLTRTIWGDTFFGERAAGLTSDDRASVARTIWSALHAGEGSASGAVDLLGRSPHLWRLAVDHLAEEDFERSLAPADAEAVDRVLSLPPRFRSMLVHYALRHNPDKIRNASAVLGVRLGTGGGVSFGANTEDAPWIEALADAGTWRYCEALWLVVPERALAKTVAIDLGDKRSTDWFYTAPPGAYAALIDHLSRFPRPLPDWAILWLRRRVLDGGVDADRAYALVEGSLQGAHPAQTLL